MSVKRATVDHKDIGDIGIQLYIYTHIYIYTYNNIYSNIYNDNNNNVYVDYI